MSTEDGGGEEEPTACDSAPGSEPGSPKNRVKFLCSHGGKILPRPADGHLKYVGGETRVISVVRDISFPELMKKLTYLIDGEMVLKYQLIPEDLDALVSVKSDEDLRHMFEEYDRHESLGSPRLRAFLFPANPMIIIDNHIGSMDRHTLEQRYINSINGIVQPMPHGWRPTPLSVSHASFSISSACSSPRSSPDSIYNTDVLNHEATLLHGYQGGRSSMHKVHSSPSLCNLNGQPQNNPQIHQHHHHYYQNYRQPPNYHHHGYQSQKPPIDPHPHKSGEPDHLIKVRSVGRTESSRYQMDHVPHYHYSPTRPSRGDGCCNKYTHFEDYGAFGYGRIERAESLPGSPIPRSPRHGYYGSKAWDSSIAGHI